MLLVLVAYLQDLGALYTVKSVLGPVETLVLSGCCAEFCQDNCVPLPKQCLGLINSVSISILFNKKSLAELQWLLDNTETLTVLFVPQMQRLT